MKLLHRLRALVSNPEPADEAPAPERSASRRRRGRRGGRGRGRGRGGDANNQQPGGTNTPTAQRTERTTRTEPNRSQPAADRDRDRRSGSGRRVSDRRPDTRSRRPRRDSLDAPLPEDIAFRPANEGGDGSILPGRRRPPPGARTTNRVFVAGRRILPIFPGSRDDEPPPPAGGDAEIRDAEDHDAEDHRSPAAAGRAAATSGEARDSQDGDETAPRGRRRRGRRGGRGRGGSSGGGQASNGATPAADDAGDEVGDQAEPAREPADAPDVDPADLPQAFAALGSSQRTLIAVARMGFSEPTPVQERSIPVLLQGRDVVGIAQTGTGKTLAFGIPMVEALDPSGDAVQGLVLVPTRELAQQVLTVLEDLARPFGMRAIGLLGGHALQGDFRALEAGPQIVVGTPGRIKDHLRRGTLSLRQVRMAVLDEADQMLDIGFLPDITHILGRTPRSRQTALFSATMPHTVMRLVRRYMEDPERIAVASDLETVDSIEHVYYEVAQRDKVKGLRELIDRELRGRTLVFSRTKRGVDRLTDLLQGLGVRVGALHGDLDQRRRDSIVRRFRGGELDILIATNVAARGIDIPEITHVVNFDVPDNAEEYVHRTGRTGRAGREGKAISFVSEVDLDRFDVLRETFGDRLQKERLELYV